MEACTRIACVYAAVYAGFFAWYHFPPTLPTPLFFFSLSLTQLSLFSRVTTEAGMLMLENQFWPLFFGCFFFGHPIYSSRKHSRVSNVVVLKEGGEGGGLGFAAAVAHSIQSVEA
jgi:hypothetical protein